MQMHMRYTITLCGFALRLDLHVLINLIRVIVEYHVSFLRNCETSFECRCIFGLGSSQSFNLGVYVEKFHC